MLPGPPGARLAVAAAAVAGAGAGCCTIAGADAGANSCARAVDTPKTKNQPRIPMAVVSGFTVAPLFDRGMPVLTICIRKRAGVMIDEQSATAMPTRWVPGFAK